MSGPVRLLTTTLTRPLSPLAPFSYYIDSRVPGSLFLNIDSFPLPAPPLHLPHPFPSLCEFKQKMAALDIERNDTIVLIDDICVAGAARFWAIFRAFGASDVSVLDGGKMKWEREGRILDTQLFLTQQERDSLPEHTLDAKVQEWVALQAKIGSQERNRLRDLRGERQDWELVKGEEILDFEDVNACSYLIRNNKIDYELVDARGAPRFNAEVKEPRGNILANRQKE